MKREFLQNLKVAGESLPKDVIDAIMEENGRDIQNGKIWKEKYEKSVADHEKQLAELAFQQSLQQAVTKAGGRNVKAIAALLDLESLRAAPEGLEAALEQLKGQCDYLFSQSAPPPFAAGTGTQTAPVTGPVTLASALRERFNK